MDVVCWNLGGKKKFTVKSIYEALMTTRIKYFMSPNQSKKYGFTLMKIMCEGIPSRIFSQDIRLAEYSFSSEFTITNYFL